MIGYPYFRSDLPLEATALRVPCVNGDWDPSSDRLLIPAVVTGEPLKVEARLIADIPSVYTLPLLPTRHRLTLFAVARCPATRWASVLGKWSIPEKLKSPFETSPVAIDLDSERIAGQVKLSVCLCLADNRECRSGFFAHRRLNILAEKKFRILLGGLGGGLTEWVSFREKELPPGLWYLHLPDGDLSQPLDGLPLWLNKDVQGFHRLLTASAGQRQETKVAHRTLLRVIAVEFLQSLLLLSFASESDLPDSMEDVPDTCWSAVFAVCAKVFDEEWDSGNELASFQAMRERYGIQPNLLETRIQAHQKIGTLIDSFDALRG